MSDNETTLTSSSHRNEPIFYSTVYLHKGMRANGLSLQQQVLYRVVQQPRLPGLKPHCR